MSRKNPLLSVEEARGQMLEAIAPLPSEQLALTQARGRVLSETPPSRRDHPAFDVSAMDGYAVRSADVTAPDISLRVTGSLAAGNEHTTADIPRIEAGETMRIFTGARLPQGADAILIQENARQEDERVTFSQAAEAGRYVRRQGGDFSIGDELLHAGERLGERDLALLAAMGYASARVYRKPRVALLALGSELAAIGDTSAVGKLPSSNSIGMAAFVEKLGGEAVDLGIVRDDITAIGRVLQDAQGCDLLVTMGGASVGEHDLTRAALENIGFDVRFHGVAMRPGKPLLFATASGMAAVGMPGNPVSTLVCAEVFLRPAIDKLQGGSGRGLQAIRARLTRDLDANNERQEYMRAGLIWDSEQDCFAITPFASQDSARLSTLSKADALAIRPPHAPAAKKGESIDALLLD